MQTLNLLSLLALIIGGVNWGLIGFFNVNVISQVFGEDTFITNLLYLTMGAAALYQMIPFSRACDIGEVRAEAALR